MPVELRTDPKHEPGAYLSFEGKLYYVIRFEPTGSNSGKLWVDNCLTDQRVWLSGREVGLAKLVKPAPSLDIPDAV